MNDTQPLPCPFCGSTAIDFITRPEEPQGIPVAASCGQCGAQGPWLYATASSLERSAFDAWNQRGPQAWADWEGVNE